MFVNSRMFQQTCRISYILVILIVFITSFSQADDTLISTVSNSKGQLQWYQIGLKSGDVRNLGTFGQEGEYVGYGSWYNKGERGKAKVSKDQLGQFAIKVEGIDEAVFLGLSKGSGQVFLDRDIDNSGGSDCTLVTNRRINGKLVWRLVYDPFLNGRDVIFKRRLFGDIRDKPFLFKSRASHDKLALLKSRKNNLGDRYVKSIISKGRDTTLRRRISIKQKDLPFVRPLAIRGRDGRDYFGFRRASELVLINQRGRKIGELDIGNGELIVLRGSEEDKVLIHNREKATIKLDGELFNLPIANLNFVSKDNVLTFDDSDTSPTEIPNPTVTIVSTPIATQTNTPNITIAPTSTPTIIITSTPIATQTNTPNITITPTSTATPSVTPTAIPNINNFQITVDNLYTKDRRPTLIGTVNDTNAQIQISVNGVSYNGWNIGNGYWVLSGLALSSDLVDGLYNVTATAVRVNGQTAVDSTTNELEIDNTGPSVLSAQFSDGIIGTNNLLNVTVNIDEDATVIGVPRIALVLDYSSSNVNVTRYANYDHSASTSRSLVFSYSVGSGDLDSDGVSFASSIDLSNGNFKDDLGNSSTLILTPPTANLNNILVDSIGPNFSSGGNFLLDLYPNVSGVAYGLRRLDKDYTGSAIRVRRTSDSAEQDIGFTPNGHLNTLQMEYFRSNNGTVIGDNLNVVRWYDQSGNGNHAGNNNQTNQPSISTTVVSANTARIGLLFDGNDFLDSDLGFAFVNNNSYATQVVDARSTNFSGIQVFFGQNSNTNNRNLHFGYRNNASLTIDHYGFGVGLNGAVSGYTTPTINLRSAYLDTSLGRYLYSNGTLLNSTASTSGINNSIGGSIGKIGTVPSDLYNGHLYEIILNPVNQLSNRVAIEGEIKSYYGIP
jgi:hypothetical protein